MKDSKETGVVYSRKILFMLLLVTLLVVVVISFSFAVYMNGEEGVNNTIEYGDISMKYIEKENSISIDNAMPTSDDVGMKQFGKNEYFDFTVNSRIVGNVKIEYEIAASKNKDSTIPDNEIKLYLEKEKNGTYVKVADPKNYIPEDKQTEIGTPAGDMLLYKVEKIKKSTDDNSVEYVDNYRLRMWLDENATMSDVRKFSVTVNVYGKTKK